MRIGKQKAKFTIRIYNNKTNKTKSFVVDVNLKIEELSNLIKKLLGEHYER